MSCQRAIAMAAEILVALGALKKLPKSGVTEMREPNHGTMMKNDETRLLGGSAMVEIVFLGSVSFLFGGVMW